MTNEDIDRAYMKIVAICERVEECHTVTATCGEYRQHLVQELFSCWLNGGSVPSA